MNLKNKIFTLGLILTVFLTVSCVCAGENETVLDDSGDDGILQDDVSVDEDNYNAEFIADNVNVKYSPYNEYNVWLLDDNGNDIEGEDVRLVWKDGRQESLEEWGDDYGYATFVDKSVGNYKATVVLKNSDYNAKPVTINVKITKATVKLTAKKWVSTTKQYAVMKVYVKDHNDDPVDEGKVKFTVNGKSYNVNVHDGVAIKKIKPNKARNYRYKVTFTGKNYNSKSVYSKLYVKKAKKYYTLKIRNTKIKKTFTVNFPYSKYVKILTAKNNNKFREYCISTGIKRPPEWGGGEYSVGLSTNNEYFPYNGYEMGDYLFLRSSSYLTIKKINLYTANF